MPRTLTCWEHSGHVIDGLAFIEDAFIILEKGFVMIVMISKNEKDPFYQDLLRDSLSVSPDAGCVLATDDVLELSCHLDPPTVTNLPAGS